MAHVINALKKAIIQKIMSDSEISQSTLIKGVYDVVAENKARPFIWFSEAIVEERDVSEQVGHALELSLEIWSRAADGPTYAWEIARHVERILKDADLSPEGHKLIMLDVLSAQQKKQNVTEKISVEIKLRAVTETL